jgi:hypothetical protein
MPPRLGRSRSGCAFRSHASAPRLTHPRSRSTRDRTCALIRPGHLPHARPATAMKSREGSEPASGVDGPGPRMLSDRIRIAGPAEATVPLPTRSASERSRAATRGRRRVGSALARTIRRDQPRLNTKPHETVCREPTLGLRCVASKSPSRRADLSAHPPYLDPSRFLSQRPPAIFGPVPFSVRHIWTRPVFCPSRFLPNCNTRSPTQPPSPTAGRGGGCWADCASTDHSIGPVRPLW